MKTLVSGEKPKRRPPKNPNKPRPEVEEEGFNAQVTDMKAFTFPRPPGASGPLMTIVNDPAVFFDWWLGLDFPPEDDQERDRRIPAKGLGHVKQPEGQPQTNARYTVYVKRLLPVCDPGRVNDNAFQYSLVASRWPFWQEDATTPETNWKKALLEMFGSGRYKIEMIDRLAQRSIAVTEAQVEDWARHLPKLNLETLLVDHKDNQRWVQMMRQKGMVLPGDRGYGAAPKDEEEDLMANTSPVMELMTDLAKKGAGLENQGSSTDQGLMVEVVRDALRSKHSAGISPTEMISAMSQMLQSLHGQSRSSESSEVINQMKALIDIQSARMQTLQDEHNRREQMWQDRESRLRDELRGKDEKIHQLQLDLLAAKSKPPEDLLTSIKRVNEIKEAMGVRTRRIEAPAEKEPSWMEALAPLVPHFAPLLQQLLVGAAVPGQPQAQTRPSFQPSQPPQSSQPSSQQPQPSQQPHISQDALQAFGTEKATMLFDMYSVVLGMIQEPLTKYILDPEKNGEDFADLLIEMKDYGTYKSVSALGPETIVSAIITYGPIWDSVKHLGMERLTGFVDRFVRAEDIWQKEEEEEEKSKETQKPN